MSSCDICSVIFNYKYTGDNMKQLLFTYIFSAENILEESLPITKTEFNVSLVLIVGALVMFGIAIHIFGAGF